MSPLRPASIQFIAALMGCWIAHAQVDYLKEIKPILQSRCYVCHGALKEKARLRLDTVAFMLKGGKSGASILPGDPDHSLLIQRVTSTNLDERMPPEHEGEPLSGEQTTRLRRWIASGAPAPKDEKPETDPREHWAFRPRTRPSVPFVSNVAWVKNPIDAFLAQQHERFGLQPQPEARPATLLRRLNMDLVGVPPTLAEIRAFEQDHSPAAYERTVDRLLNDPRHGERWARHWMDIWRYSDWWGLGEELRNSQKHIWHWRDWIVESLNADTPYDDMVRLMLAADELHPGDPGKLRATGFLARNYFLFNRNSWMEETIEHVGKGFLGLTFNCAKCHDHKYDPIAQKDYYRMRAFFEPYQARLDMTPGELDLTRDGLPRIFDAHLDMPTYLFIRGQETNPDKSDPLMPGVPEVLSFKPLSIHPVRLPIEASQPERKPWVLEGYLAAARKNLSMAKDKALKAQEKLTTERQRTPDAPTTQTSSSTPPKAAGASEMPPPARAEAEARLAALAVDTASAELESVQRRITAMRAAWAGVDSATTTSGSRPNAEVSEKDAAAIRAERALKVAKARQALAAVEWRLASATADQKKAVEKEVTTAREALEKEEKNLGAPITPNETYTRLAGAQWTTTRFVHPNRDDPEVKFPSSSTGRRTALADWITDAHNPLTARVAANHIWARHMGTPLAASVFEFGRKGQAPTHPELLDWLASELVDNGWSMKHLHRLIVTSTAYRMSSSLVGAEGNLAKDPDNRRWWRRTPIRIEAEAVRDSVLALSGTLDGAQGGPPVPASSQASSKRRSLYFFHSNNERNLFLTTFDGPGVNECYQRDQSIVPQQALALSNSAFVRDASESIASRLSGDGALGGQPPRDDSEFVRNAFLGLLGVRANEAEMAASMKALKAWRAIPSTSESPGVADGARVNLIWALINHNDFVTLR